MAETEPRNLLDDVRAAMTEVESGGKDGGADAGGAATERNGAGGDDPAVSPNATGGDGRAGDETAEQTAQRKRDEAGRFAKETKPRETLKLKESPAPAVVASAEKVAPPPVATAAPGAPDAEAIAAPAEWKGAGKVQWNKLPKAVQAELRDTYQGLAASRAEMEPMQQAIAPYKEAWVRDAGSVPAAVAELGRFYELYLTNPVGLIQHIAAQRGINLGSAQGQAPAQGATQPAPDIATLIAQVVQQQVAPITAHFQQTENQQLQSTIDAFGSDPSHPYFQDVKVHMGRLISAGAAKDMQDAYDQATWANPVIRQQLLDQQAEATKQTQAAALAKARQASAVNLSGSPLAGVVNGTGTKGESVHDAVRRNFAEVEGA